MSTATKVITKSEVLNKWLEFEKIVSEWEKSQESKLFLNFRGRTSKAISEAIIIGFAEVAAFIDSTDFSPDAWNTVLAIDDVFDAFEQWGRDMENHPDDTDPNGSPKLWYAYHKVREAAAPVVIKNVESVHQLAAIPNMPHSQIAKTYGWYDELGNPDVTKVAEELEHPGMHTKNWVNPIVRRKNEELRSKWTERCEKLSGRHFTGPKKRNEVVEEKRKIPPAPESVEELCRLPGITTEQIATMKQITIEEVREIAAKARIAIDHTVAELMRTATAERIPGLQKMVDSQTEINVASIYTYPELSTMDERIDAMLDDRIKPGLIASALKQSFPAISYQTVVKRADERRTERIAKRNAIRTPADQSSRPKSKDKSRGTAAAPETA